MADGTANTRKIPDGAYGTAQEMLEAGQSGAAVEQKLVAMGVDVETARQIIADHQRATAQVENQESRTNMQWGPIALGLGVLVLLVSGPGSVVGWLGVVSGGSRFAYGLWKKRTLRDG